MKPPDVPFVLVPPIVSKPMRLILIGWIFGGVTILIGQVVGFEVSPALNAGPEFVELAFAAMLVTGSLLINLSTLRWKNKSTSWKLEVFAWPLLISAWLIYVTTALLLPHPVVFPTILGIGYTAASAFRLSEVLRSIKLTRRHVEAMQKDGWGQ